jgi:hypothetical protein
VTGISAINRRGQIVGSARESFSAAILIEDGVVYDLNLLVEAQSSGGMYLLRATDINSRGQIVGYGLKKREPYAFLLDPAEASAPTY